MSIHKEGWNISDRLSVLTYPYTLKKYLGLIILSMFGLGLDQKTFSEKHLDNSKQVWITSCTSMFSLALEIIFLQYFDIWMPLVYEESPKIMEYNTNSFSSNK